MTDWGIPDWRDAAAYADTSAWSHERWRWEFLRRREDLRRDYLELLREKSGAKDVAELLRSPDGWPQFIATRGLSRYGYDFLPNPRVSDHPEAILKYASTSQLSSGLHTYFDVHGVPAYAEGVFFSPEEAVWVFDLTADLDTQIEAARDALRPFMIRPHLKPKKERNHRRNWPTYLRVLDARTDGATLFEVATILPKTYSSRDEKTAHNVIDQAKKLQFSI